MALDPSVIPLNRATLRQVPAWINRSDWVSPPSIFNYGLPDYIYDAVSQPINDEVTEADVLCNYILSMSSLNYLEIGVSVGKTFYQILQFAKAAGHLPNYRVSCIDIEKINPVLKDLLGGPASETRVVPTGSTQSTMRHIPTNTISSWSLKGGRGLVTYYEADEFDTDIWGHMPRHPYNLIFSDALHEHNALIAEYTSLKKNNLLDWDGGFIYAFDDLENDSQGPLWQAFHKILVDIKGRCPNATFEHLRVNGWAGEHEGKHNFGVIRVPPCS